MTKPNISQPSYSIIKMNRVKATAFHSVFLGGTPLEIANQKRSLETFKKNCHRFEENPMEEWYRVQETEKLLADRVERNKFLVNQIPSLGFAPSTESSIPSHRHSTIWDFYDAIGYRREKQAFIHLINQ